MSYGFGFAGLGASNGTISDVRVENCTAEGTQSPPVEDLSVSSPPPSLGKSGVIFRNLEGWNPRPISSGSAPSGGSPYTYPPTANEPVVYDMVVYLVGGSVSQVQLVRSGSISTTISSTGAVVLYVGDQIIITYSWAPTIVNQPL